MTATTAGIADTTEPLARQFVHRPLSDEFFAEALDDISRSYRDLPILDNDAVPLWEELGAWVRATAAQLRREYQITVYDDLDPYETAEQMHADIARGVYKVTSLHSNHPVWDKDTNVAFRITHDITGHGLTRSDFSFKGEVAAYRNQCLSTPEHLWPVLFTEVVAQSAYANVHHLFGEQKVALVPLTQDEIDAHVGQIMDAPDPGYDPLHVSASDHSSQRAWYTVADSIRARQHKAAAVGAKPVLHLLADDDDAALLNLLMHHADDLEASAGVVDVEFGRLGLEEIRRSHGFTVHDHFGDSPRSGYMVSISPATEKVIPLASVTAQDIADYRNAHKDLLADPDNYFGAWVWEGNVYLDISRNVRDRDEALALGRRYNQLGIYDLARGETIEVPVAVAARRVFAMRACENCGARMSPFLPRRRLPDGSLVCKGCEKRHHEAALATLEGEEHPDQHIAATEGHTPSCEACGKPATWEVRGPLDTDEAYFACDDHKADAERQFPGRAPEVSKVGTRKVAHDSGDGETVFHCPFCGAGAVLGRSDGTIECQFCKTAFTVQVQPVRSSVPQTIDGVPHIHPDMPGGPTSEEPGQAPEDPGAQVLDKTTITPAADEDPKVYAARVEPYYLAADGMPMAEGSYLKHIALRYADDPGAVLASLVPKEDR